MADSAAWLERVRAHNRAMRELDPDLAEEALEVKRVDAVEVAAEVGSIDDQLALESIVMRTERPVLTIRDDAPVLQFVEESDSQIWKARLEAALPVLHDAIRAVGRIELVGSEYDWVGTGWLVHDSILVTNRHVAQLFAMRSGQGFVFQTGTAGKVSASVDFLREHENPNTLVFKLLRPLFIQDEPGPDVAFFEVEARGGNGTLAQKIPLADGPSSSGHVAVIGYPAYDSRIPDVDLMEHIYGSLYNIKRLAPGTIRRNGRETIEHTCTTLGGCSGAVMHNLDGSGASGLHFSGRFMKTNYAVPAAVVKKLLASVRSGRVKPEVRSVAAAPVSTPTGLSAGRVLGQVTIPLTITISIGGASMSTSAAMQAEEDDLGSSSDVDDFDEAAPADYADRAGYDETFLGDDATVPLPDPGRHARDVLTYDNDGNQDHLLRYEHYSVVMSKSRRMCLFSAVNIDGEQLKKASRVNWKWDPRIPRQNQIMDECYGNPPRFSRGHMTRREDPGWGDASTSRRGNEDSMHVTNTVPQMQAFNSPIWLALEDYALGHARQDAMRISVFTGPYFARNDPIRYGVKIPRAFWKIIAFIHDETGELCATGYEMSQSGQLQPEEEFVFGGFTSAQLNVATQVPIRSIETRSGLDFGGLADVDPLSGNEAPAGLDGGGPPLQMLEQIRFF